MGRPRRITVFSRDEAKQHHMRLEYSKKPKATDEIIYDNFRRSLQFRIGKYRLDAVFAHDSIARLRDNHVNAARRQLIEDHSRDAC